VQVVFAGVFKDVGLQVNPLTPTGGATVTVMAPPVPFAGISLPVNEAATTPVTEMEVPPVTVDARVTVTTAVTPFRITLELIPVRRQVYDPGLSAHATDLPAAVPAAPVAADIDTMLEGEYVSVH